MTWLRRLFGGSTRPTLTEPARVSDPVKHAVKVPIRQAGVGRPPDGYVIREHEIQLETIPFINTVQIQPSRLLLDGADFHERNALVDSLVNWLLGTATVARVEAGVLPSSESLPVPSRPWLLALPEAFTPYEKFVEILAAQLEPGSIIMTGLSPADGHVPTDFLFDLASLEKLNGAILQSGARFLNPELIEETRGLLDGGGRANLAATMVIDREGRPTVVLHIKLTRSKFERPLAAEKNTVEGTRLDAIVLRASRPPNGRVVIVPLICADFSTPNAYSQERIAIERWNDDGERPVDLICVLNIQPCRPQPSIRSASVPWPPKVAAVIESLGRRQYGHSFERAHLMLTNVGEYGTADTVGRLIPGGHSCLAITGNPLDVRIDEYRDWLTQFEGESLVFARANFSGGQGETVEQWFDLRVRQPKHCDPVESTMLLLPGPPFEHHAIGLQIRCELGKRTGIEAVSAARRFVITSDYVLAPARKK